MVKNIKMTTDLRLERRRECKESANKRVGNQCLRMKGYGAGEETGAMPHQWSIIPAMIIAILGSQFGEQSGCGSSVFWT